MGKYVTSKTYADKQKKNKGKWFKPYNQIAEISNNEITCQKCGFTVRYRFLRCPECNVTQIISPDVVDVVEQKPKN